jgi:LPXTG-motif cell wall-anchored protein
MTHGDGQIMKDYKAAALALPTIVALTLGGVALTAAPALAGQAPITSEPAEEASADDAPADDGAGAPSTEAAADGDVLQPADAAPQGGSSSVPTPPDMPDTPDAVDGVVDGADAPAAGEEAPVEAQAEVPFALVSPTQGQVFTEFGLVVAGTVDFAGTIEVRSPDGLLLGSALVAPGEWSIPVSFFEQPAGPLRLVVTAISAADPTVRAVETRDLLFAVPTSPAPTITAPAAPVVTAEAWPGSGTPVGSGVVTFRGTGVAGSEIDIEIERTDGGEASGHGHDPIVVQPDGTWIYVDSLQTDAAWRVSARQFVTGAVFLTSRPSAWASRDFRLAAPAPAPAPAPPVVDPSVTIIAAVAEPPAVTATTVRPVARPALAHTGAEHVGDAALAGLALLVLGSAATLVGRRRRRA